MVIWLLDRYDEKEERLKSYGLVFIGNPALEEEDKFQMNSFMNLYSFESIRLVAESLPTFYGYVFLEDIKNIVSEEELRIYQENKKKGIMQVATDYLDKLSKKEDGDNGEKNELDAVVEKIKKRHFFKFNE